ncbi:MAG: KR domain-containing protein, partial [Planctomycetaceae bacterium]|nr:KR domain-containing protein [Planctomycetaceae bacterium]
IQELLETVQESMPPLAGVFHLAMVLDDAFLTNLDQERFFKVTRPKSHAAWHLHRLTQHCPLDLFVLFSSASAAVGNFGQANYAAANAELESLAAHRRQLGLPATAIAWGVLGEVGYVAEREELGESLEKLGFTPMSVADVRNTLDAVLAPEQIAGQTSTVVAVRVDWQLLGQKFRAAQQTPGLLSDLITKATVEEESSSGIRESITTADPSAQKELMENFLRSRVARVLGMSPQKLDVDRPLSEMGLDSLMAVEFGSLIEADLGTSLSVSALSRDVTINKLSHTLLKTLLGQSADEDPSSESGEALQEPSSDWLVPLRKGTEGDPLILFAPAGGDLGIYDHLLPQLDGEFPVFGFQMATKAKCADDLSRKYAQAIRAAFPDRAVQLLGFSFGGLLAARTAGHLEQSGQPVRFVGIMECNPA